MLKEKKIIICFPHADECMQFQIPDVRVVFYFLWMWMEREGGDMEREIWLAGCCCWTATVALAKKLCGCSTGKEERLLIILGWTEISCKAEMLCLGQARAELWSANELEVLCSCVTVLASLRSCVKTSAPSLAIQAIWKQTESNRNP